MFVAPEIPSQPLYSYVMQDNGRDIFTPVRQLSSTGGARMEGYYKRILEAYLRYRLFEDSFLSHGGKDAPETVKKEFDYIAQEFRSIAFKRVSAEYSSMMELLQFSLDFSNGMRVSFGKPLDDVSSDVFFSLAVDNEVILVDRKSVEDLRNVLLETVQD